MCPHFSIYQRYNVLYKTNYSRGGNFRYIREFGFCAKFSSRENKVLYSIHYFVILTTSMTQLTWY